MQVEGSNSWLVCRSPFAAVAQRVQPGQRLCGANSHGRPKPADDGRSGPQAPLDRDHGGRLLHEEPAALHLPEPPEARLLTLPQHQVGSVHALQPLHQVQQSPQGSGEGASRAQPPLPAAVQRLTAPPGRRTSDRSLRAPLTRLGPKLQKLKKTITEFIISLSIPSLFFHSIFPHIYLFFCWDDPCRGHWIMTWQICWTEKPNCLWGGRNKLPHFWFQSAVNFWLYICVQISSSDADGHKHEDLLSALLLFYNEIPPES